MEPSPTAHRPQTLIFAGLGVGQILSCFTAFAMTLGPPAQAGVAAWPPPRPDPPTRPRGKDAWHSYAVYSGALSPRRHKSSRRLP
jgi:hypothetical protein